MSQKNPVAQPHIAEPATLPPPQTAPRTALLPSLLAYLGLAGAAAAGAIWYAFPQAGSWPINLAVAPWALRLLLTGRLTRRTPFDLPILLFLITAGLAVWSAYHPAAAWPKFWLIVGGILLFYAFVNASALDRGALGDRRGWLLALFCAGVALYFLAVHDWDEYPAKIDALTTLGRALQAPLTRLYGGPLPGHRLHPNVAGGIIAMMLPFAAWTVTAAWAGVRSRTRGARLALALSLALLATGAFGLLMTTSRAAWLGLAAAAFLAALWAASGLLSRRHPQRRAVVLPALGLAVLAILAAAGLLFGAADRSVAGWLIAAADHLPGDATWLGRSTLIRNTWPLVGDYPFVGAGLGGFQMLYSTYAILVHVGVTVHSHNLFLDVAVEQGLVALIALVITWLLFAILLARHLFTPSPPHPLLGPAALSLTVLLIHGIADDVLYGSRAVLLLFVPLAFAVPTLQHRPSEANRPALWLPLLLLLLIAAAVIWRRPILSYAHANLGAVYQSRAELSRYTWPEWPIQDELRRQIDLDPAVAHFERALALDPANPTANRRLAMIELARADYPAARAHLQAAYAADPAAPITRMLLGEALIATGDQADGLAILSTVDTGHVAWPPARAWWYQHLGNSVVAAAIEGAADK